MPRLEKPQSQFGGTVAPGCGAERQVQTVVAAVDRGNAAPNRPALSTNLITEGPALSRTGAIPLNGLPWPTTMPFW